MKADHLEFGPFGFSGLEEKDPLDSGVSVRPLGEILGLQAFDKDRRGPKSGGSRLVHVAGVCELRLVWCKEAKILGTLWIFWLLGQPTKTSGVSLGSLFGDTPCCKAWLNHGRVTKG